MIRISLSMTFALVMTSLAWAQTPPSYAKVIRPFLTKYCSECHNAKEMKASLNLDSYKSMMDGADGGAVIVAGKPDDSRLVLLIEHKDKPSMPPPKAKFQPTKAEIAAVRAWVKAGAKDDGASVKIVLPVIKAKVNALPPVTAISYSSICKRLLIGRNEWSQVVDLGREATDGKNLPVSGGVLVTALACSSGTDKVAVALSEPGKGGLAFIAKVGGAWYHNDPPAHKDTILSVALDSKGECMASAGYDTGVHLCKSGKTQVVLKEHSDAVYSLAFSPDGKLLASVSADRTMKVWDVQKGKLLYTLGHATDWLYAVAWSPDGKYLVSGGVDKSIRVYEPRASGARLRQSVFAHEGPVLKLVFSSDSKTLYSVGEDRVVKAWDIEKMVERKVYTKQPETVLCLALREDAGQIIVGRYDGIVQLIDMKTGKVAQEFGKQKDVEKGRQGKGEKKSTPSPQASNASLRGQAAINFLSGTLERAGAVHVHRLAMKKGQQLGVQITVQGKAKFEPVLTFSDSAGRALAESYDGHLGHKFAEAGSCSISVRDRDFRGGADFKYRLAVGEIPIVTAAFPMGMRRGTTGYIHLDGVFLPKEAIPFSVPAAAKPGQMISLRVGDNVLGKAQVVVGEFPEVQAGAIPVPGTANGRLIKENQADLWRFHAKKGERLIVEVNARRIGSRLDSVIEILDKNGQPVPRAVLRSQAKTEVTFRDHDSAQGNIRIHAWSDLAVNDFLFVGNELMKIQALPTHPDADCNFFKAAGKRLAYLDTTPTHHANGTPMYKVTLHPPGTIFPPNGFPVFTLYYRNDDGGPGYGRDSRIEFDPPADGEYQVRIADARGFGGANFGYRLTVRPPRPGFRLLYDPKNLTLAKGGAVAVNITAERSDGFDGPIEVGVAKLPAGLSMPKTTIEAGTYATTVALYADADAKLPAKPFRTLLEGKAIVGKTHLRFAQEFELPRLIEPGDIVTTTAESAVSIKAGGQTTLRVNIERRNGFKGRVPLDVRGLPHGMRVLDIGLNGILINENETARTIVLYAEPWVEPMQRPFVVLAKREGKKTEHAAKAVMLTVR